MTRPERHALLADPTRRALLDALRRAAGPLDVAALAGQLGLHRNSARDQLRRLQAAGLVRATPASPAGRGRPGLRYELAADPDVDAYRDLAEALADEVAGLPAGEAVVEAAGERWGRRAAAAAGPGRPAMAALVDLLDRAGFAPEPARDGDAEIRLHDCPFLPIERRHLPVVCGVHLGFIRGALRELGSPLDATAIEPFVRPDLCVARLGSSSGD